MGRQALMLALMLALATTARGQEMTITLSGGRIADHAGAGRGGVSLRPAIGWTDGLNAVALRGVATALAGAGPQLGVGADTRVRLIGAGAVGLDLAAAGDLLTAGEWRATAGRVSPRLSAAGLGWSVGAGPVLGVVHERNSTEATSGGLLPGPTRTEATSDLRALQGVSIEGRAVHGPIGVSGGWTRLGTSELRWEEVVLAASLRARRVTVGARGGLRLGAAGESWGAASASVGIGDGAALQFEGGRFPADPVLGREGGEYLTAGLRIGTMLR